MKGWKGNLLNQAGKKILIKAVIQAMSTYVKKKMDKMKKISLKEGSNVNTVNEFISSSKFWDTRLHQVIGGCKS